MSEGASAAAELKAQQHNSSKFCSEKKKAARRRSHRSKFDIVFHVDHWWHRKNRRWAIILTSFSGQFQYTYKRYCNIPILKIRQITDVEKIKKQQKQKLTAMMTGSLPSSSSSSTTSSNGSLRLPASDDQFVDDFVSRLIKEDSEDDLVFGLNSLLKQ